MISRTSAFAFQGKNLEVTEIGRRLRVGTALEGSVRKAGDRVRVTAQLVNAEDGYQLWSKRFDRELSDVFAIQDEIAATIVNELRSGLAGAPRSAEATAGKPAGKRASLDVAAHDAYLKGMYALNKWTDDSMQRAIADFRDAIARDPGFAPAYAALAEGHIWLYSGLGILPANETVPQARWAVEKALELDPTLADAHKVRALIAMNHDWDRQGAEEALTRALELGPGSAAAHLWNAWRLALLERRHDQALDRAGRGRATGPSRSPGEDADRLRPLFPSRSRSRDRAVRKGPGAGAVLCLCALCAGRRVHADGAVRPGIRGVRQGDRAGRPIGEPHRRPRLCLWPCRETATGPTALLQELTARAAQGYVSAMWIALVHLGLSDLESLFHWLDRAFEERDGSLILITAAVEFDPVRDDPRFKSLLGRMGLGSLRPRRPEPFI